MATHLERLYMDSLGKIAKDLEEKEHGTVQNKLFLST